MWRTARDIHAFLGMLEFRVTQRYIEQLIHANYLERNGRYLASTKNALSFINGESDGKNCNSNKEEE